MNTTLWVLQAVLSAFFIMPAIGKISNSKQKHIDDNHIQPGNSVILIRILGILELLGCIGIIVPWLTGVAPILTPITAVCFCMIMLAGVIINIRRKEYKMLPMLLVVFAFAAVVAYYRFLCTS